MLGIRRQGVVVVGSLGEVQPQNFQLMGRREGGIGVHSSQ